MRKNLYYYVVGMGKFYFGKACRDVLTAQLTLDRARRCYPNEPWSIVEICA